MRKIFTSIIFLSIFSVIVLPAAAQTKQPRLSPVAEDRIAKITPDMTLLPPEFIGHDIRILYNNLAVLGKDVKGKVVYDKLTADDLFAFSDYSVSPSGSVSASKTGSADQFVFSGDLWRLRGPEEFPEPDVEYMQACFTIGSRAESTVASRDELVSPLISTSDTSAWKEAFFPIKTFPLNKKRKDYKGYDVGVRCKEIFVPIVQMHYGLSFNKEQPFRLVNVTDKYVFSLQTYGGTSLSGPGFVTWHGNDIFTPKNSGDVSHLFIVRLVPPYVASRTFTAQDKVEGKVHTAVRHKIYVDLIGVWLYNRYSGTIISKEVIDKLP